MTRNQITPFIHGQLLSLHMTNSLRHKNEAGNYYPRKAWKNMIDTLLSLGYMDNNCMITKSGIAYLEGRHEAFMSC
jgi:hypothetical protein